MAGFDELEHARRHYSQAQAETMGMYGLNQSVGLLYGAMIFREAPLTLEDMCKETGMSKTSMSTGVRELARLQLVRKAFRPGVRKDLYEVERSQFTSFIEYFTKLWRRASELNLRAIRQSEAEIRKILQDTDNEELQTRAEEDLKILSESTTYYLWLRELTDAFERGDINVPIPTQAVHGEASNHE
ncbi:GbsR/MarR family transcriptional regulator [Alicyclobacillus sp. SO9]|uniref:GbsR/MarR family transcriptional regulator n=1 Tax=Alicyclobacillus sp. SO9 TaxID=2665646 RepID=UPI0018E8F601|nr:GbsR/MarR family transcriptional regulator [Alicyclobacillus sp. SO9]QQE77225.1 GbsR/MarR family transcriptional regulator [Alicyclobacillus sp. SO9]